MEERMCVGVVGREIRQIASIFWGGRFDTICGERKPQVVCGLYSPSTFKWVYGEDTLFQPEKNLLNYGQVLIKSRISKNCNIIYETLYRGYILKERMHH